MTTVLTILGGVLTLAATALPLYFKYRTWKDSKNNEIKIADDNVARRDSFLERVRNRKAPRG